MDHQVQNTVLEITIFSLRTNPSANPPTWGRHQRLGSQSRPRRPPRGPPGSPRRRRRSRWAGCRLRPSRDWGHNTGDDDDGDDEDDDGDDDDDDDVDDDDDDIFFHLFSGSCYALSEV